MWRAARGRSDGAAGRAGLLVVGLAVALGSCLGCLGRAKPDRDGAVSSSRGGQEGIATHYATRFEGRKTASGEPYRHGAMTAAHRTLPLGTRVRVTRIDSKGKTVAGPIEVRINDRGPYGKGRIIDLSGEAARRLGILGGLARVRVEVLEKPR
jgi:rare lipoprotein A